MTPLEMQCLRALQIHMVDYLVVGGQAMRAHGLDRKTKDLDILISNSAENAVRLIAAMHTLGVQHTNLTIDAIEGRKRQINFASWGLPLEVLTDADGIEFSEAWGRRISVSMDELQVPVISREDLRVMKRNAGREIDMSDLSFLEALSR